MLVTRARQCAGETLLVVGGSGAVGTAAILIGKHLGANVHTTTRAEDKGTAAARARRAARLPVDRLFRGPFST